MKMQNLAAEAAGAANGSKKCWVKPKVRILSSRPGMGATDEAPGGSFLDFRESFRNATRF